MNEHTIKPGAQVFVGPWTVIGYDDDNYWTLDGGDGATLGVPTLVAQESAIVASPLPVKRDLTPAEQAEIESAVASGETMTASGWFVDANTEDRYVAHESGFHAAAHGRPCSPPDPNGVGADEWIEGWREATLAGLPWSDALPAVARLLADPAVVESLKAAYRHLLTYGFLPDDERANLERFAAALESNDGN